MQPRVGYRTQVGSSTYKQRLNRRRRQLLGANSLVRGRGTRLFPLRSCTACGPERLDTLHPSNPHRISDADSEGRRGRTRRIRQQIQPRPRSLTSSDLSIHRAAGNLYVEVPECQVGIRRDRVLARIASHSSSLPVSAGQVRDAFCAAGYSQEQVEQFTEVVKERITELEQL